MILIILKDEYLDAELSFLVSRESQRGGQEGKGSGETERTNRHCRPHQSGSDILREFIAPYKIHILTENSENSQYIFMLCSGVV